LGENSVAYSHLIGACHIGSRIFMLQVTSTSSQSQPETSQAETTEEVEIKNQKSRLEQYQQALQELPDAESIVAGATVSNGDSDCDDGSSYNDPFAEWLVFGRTGFRSQPR
jgi:hypothetical protein